MTLPAPVGVATGSKVGPSGAAVAAAGSMASAASATRPERASEEILEDILALLNQFPWPDNRFSHRKDASRIREQPRHLATHCRCAIQHRNRETPGPTAH